MRRSIMSSGETYEFIADHPFVFMIYSNEYDVVLFVGKYAFPIESLLRHEEL